MCALELREDLRRTSCDETRLVGWVCHRQSISQSVNQRTTTLPSIYLCQSPGNRPGVSLCLREEVPSTRRYLHVARELLSKPQPYRNRKVCSCWHPKSPSAEMSVRRAAGGVQSNQNQGRRFAFCGCSLEELPESTGANTTGAILPLHSRSHTHSPSVAIHLQLQMQSVRENKQNEKQMSRRTRRRNG